MRAGPHDHRSASTYRGKWVRWLLDLTDYRILANCIEAEDLERFDYFTEIVGVDPTRAPEGFTPLHERAKKRVDEASEEASKVESVRTLEDIQAQIKKEGKLYDIYVAVNYYTTHPFVDHSKLVMDREEPDDQATNEPAETENNANE